MPKGVIEFPYEGFCDLDLTFGFFNIRVGLSIQRLLMNLAVQTAPPRVGEGCANLDLDTLSPEINRKAAEGCWLWVILLCFGLGY